MNEKGTDEKQPWRTANNNKNSPEQDLKSDLAKLLDYEESIGKGDSDDISVSTIRKDSAYLARERRLNSRRASNQSDSDSSAVSSLSSTASSGDVPVRRIFSKDEKDTNKTTLVKSYLHRGSKPFESASSPTISSSNLFPSEHTQQPSRAQSVTITATNTSPNFNATRRQSSLHKEHVSQPSCLNSPLTVDSPTQVLNRKLSFDAAMRASSATDSGTSSFTSSNQAEIAAVIGEFKRGGSFSSIMSEDIPPVPPPSSVKPTRARSVSTTPPVSKPLNSRARPNVPPPPPPTSLKNSPTQNRKVQNPLTSSITSLSSRPSLSSVTTEEDAARILDAIATPTNIGKFRKDSIQQKPDVETTNRNSLEVPSRIKSRTSDNDSWSDFEMSDGDEEGNRLSITVSEDKENATPQPTPTVITTNKTVYK